MFKTRALEAEAFRQLNLLEPFDPEAVIALVERLLLSDPKAGSGQDAESEALRDVFIQACKSLSLVAESTWWVCDCTKIPPLSGLVDALCEHCGGLRKLPQRLSAHPWPLFVACLKRLEGDAWFVRLCAALAQADGVCLLPYLDEKLLPVDTASATEGVGSVLSDTFWHKPEVSSRKQVHLVQERSSSTRLEQMGDADDEMATDRAKQRNSAEGETSPYLLFPDGMEVLRQGDVRNLQWIAYPIPSIYP